MAKPIVVQTSAWKAAETPMLTPLEIIPLITNGRVFVPSFAASTAPTAKPMSITKTPTSGRIHLSARTYSS